MGNKLRMEKVVLSDLDLQEKDKLLRSGEESTSLKVESNKSNKTSSIIKFEKIEIDKKTVAVHDSTPESSSVSDDKVSIKNPNLVLKQDLPADIPKEKQTLVSEISDLENAINSDDFSMKARGGRFIHQKEEDNRVLINDDDAHLEIRRDDGQVIEDDYHGEACESLMSKSQESEELKEIVKKLSSLSHVKQVIVEKKKSQETTKLKMKVGNKETGEEEDIDITALDHRGRPIGIDFQRAENPNNGERLIESQTLLVDSAGNINSVPSQSKMQNITRARPKTKEEMESGLRQISEKYERKTSHERSVYKKTPKGHKNEYFYKVKSHQELYQVGMSYYRDMANGNKSMAFITHDSHKHLKDSILAIASFIKYQEDLKILIVSLGLENGSYRNVVEECRKNKTIVGEDDDAIPTIYEHAGLSFLDFKDIFSFRSKFDETGYGELIDYLVNSYDLVLWDVPKLDDLKVSKEEYFPIFIAFDKVSIVVQKQSDKYEDIHEMKKFFNKYGIKIKGILFSPQG